MYSTNMALIKKPFVCTPEQEYFKKIIVFQCGKVSFLRIDNVYDTTPPSSNGDIIGLIKYHFNRFAMMLYHNPHIFDDEESKYSDEKKHQAKRFEESFDIALRGFIVSMYRREIMQLPKGSISFDYLSLIIDETKEEIKDRAIKTRQLDEQEKKYTYQSIKGDEIFTPRKLIKNLDA